jgi:tRNA(Ile)-lysidine synthase
VTAAAGALVSAVRNELADVPAAARIIVACSGGPDSIALAAAARRSAGSVSVAIVDHGLQAGSTQVADQAAEVCRAMGHTRVDVVRVQPHGPGGPESRARRARYAALQALAEQQVAVAVLLGHTMDDQAETVFLGLTRGSGPRALAGMPRRNGVFRRPFLGLRREIVRSAFPEFTTWDDPHNFDRRFRRSLVRHEVLPAITESLGDAVIESLARSAALVRAETDAVDAWAEVLVEQHICRIGRTLAIPCEPLQPVPQAVLARVMIEMSQRAGARRPSMSVVHVTALTDLVLRWRGQGPVDLPGGVVVARVSGTVEFVQRGEQPLKETSGNK